MFTKRSDKDSAAADAASRQVNSPPPTARPTASGRGSGAPSLIGADLVITGNLECRGEVQIDGEIQGDVQAQRIIIGDRARIVGSLIAEDVVIRGSVQGSIRGNTVTLQSNSHIEGDVFHKSLSIEQGAFFEGKSRRSADPLSVPTAAPGMPPPGN